MCKKLKKKFFWPVCKQSADVRFYIEGIRRISLFQKSLYSSQYRFKKKQCEYKHPVVISFDDECMSEADNE